MVKRECNQRLSQCILVCLSKNKLGKLKMHPWVLCSLVNVEWPSKGQLQHFGLNFTRPAASMLIL